MKRMSRYLVLMGFLLVAGSAFADTPGKNMSANRTSQDADAARADVKQMFGFLPNFIDSIPDVALASAWQEMKTLQMNPDTELPGKTKELIGLAVAAQVPCDYCILAHTEFAKGHGATEAEIGEAVAVAGHTRNVSAVLSGFMPDEAAFRDDIQTIVERSKKMTASQGQQASPEGRPSAANQPPGEQRLSADARDTLDDVQQTLGMVPDFIQRFPPAALPAFWKSMKDLELSETTLDAKSKSLISLAVASQIPCRYCVIADTEFARSAGASNAEIAEAIAMAGLVRNWSTMLNGMQVNKNTFRRDVARIVQVSRRMERNQQQQGDTEQPPRGTAPPVEMPSPDEDMPEPIEEPYPMEGNRPSSVPTPNVPSPDNR